MLKSFRKEPKDSLQSFDKKMKQIDENQKLLKKKKRFVKTVSNGIRNVKAMTTIMTTTTTTTTTANTETTAALKRKITFWSNDGNVQQTFN